VKTKKKKRKVLIAGHICLDITPAFRHPPVERLTQILAPGKLIHVGQPDIHLGGAVANTGLAMDFFGINVRLAAKIGQDSFGQLVQRDLDSHSCEAILTFDESAGTSYSIVLAVPGVDRVFLHDPGANDTFCAADITDDMLNDIDHLHFGYPPLMRRMYEDDGKELTAIFRKAKAKGITTSLDMAAVDPNSPAGNADWKTILSKVLPLVDFFAPSAEEIGFMLDPKRYSQWCNQAEGRDITEILSIQEDIAPLADELIRLGASVVLIKCGASGLYYQTAGQALIYPLCELLNLTPSKWIELHGFERSYSPERIVSATGAGDTCIAAFLAAVMRGFSLKKCIRLAAAAGASCITAYDALSGLLPFDVMQQKIQAGWPKV